MPWNKIDGMRQSVLYGATSETLLFHLRSAAGDLAFDPEGEDDECNAWVYSNAGDELLANQPMDDESGGWFSLEVDPSQWLLGTGYRAKIVATISSVDYTFNEFFNVAKYPINEPLLSSAEIDNIHPEWQYIRTPVVSDWQAAIYHSHAELCNGISRLRDNSGQLIYPYRMIDRHQLRWMELIYVEHNCMENFIRAQDAEKQFYRDRKAAAMNELSSVFLDTDDDLVIDEDEEAEDISIRMRR